MNDPLTVTQVLCTRLCHDLAGPIGAVAAGVELVGGDPAQVDAETLQLIANSSQAASRKLKFLRVALGTSGAALSALKDIQQTVAGYLESIAGPSGPATVAWPPQPQFADLARDQKGCGPQMLANLILMAIEVVPRLRNVGITVAAAGDALTIAVSATGEISAHLDPRPDLVALLENPGSAAVTPKTVQSLYASDVARHAGGTLAAVAIDGGARVTATLPLGP